jgi:hypothetical protein
MKRIPIAALALVAILSAAPAYAGWQNPDNRGQYYDSQRYDSQRYDGQRNDSQRYDRGGRRERDYRDGRLLMECSGIMSRFGQYNRLFSDREEDRMDRLQARFAEESGRLVPGVTRRERERWFADGVRRADEITRRSSQRGMIIEDLLRDNLRVEMRRCRDIYRG